MNRSNLWLGGYAVATALSFPQQVGDGVVDLGWILAWVGPACLYLGIVGQAPGRAALQALLASTLGYTGVLYWAAVAVVEYGRAPLVVGGLAVVGLSLCVAAFTAGWAAVVAWLGARGRATPLAMALCWVVFDHLRSFLLTGFPWGTLGYALHDDAALVAWLPWTGIYGLSFVAVLAGTSAAVVLRARSRHEPWAMASGVTLLIVLGLHGAGWLLPRPDPSGLPTLRVAALQGNIDQGQKWSKDAALGIFRTYEAQTREAAAQGARLIVWPETALPVPLGLDAELARRVQDLAVETGADLMVGAVGVRVENSHVVDFFDSAFLIGRDGRARDRYDKSKLVPFGEFLPFRAILGGFIGALATGAAPVDVTAGPGVRAIALGPEAGSGGRGTDLRVGVPICYELLFPDLVRRFVANGSGVLLAMTNDAWYGRTGAPHQFLVMTAMRSAENGVYTVRAANTGVSAIIDASGVVLKRTEIFEATFLVDDVPIYPPGAPKTFYTRYGDVFAWACWAGLLGQVIAAVRSPRHDRATGNRG